MDACLLLRAVSVLQVEADVVSLAGRVGWSSNADELANGVRVIASKSPNGAGTHLCALLFPPAINNLARGLDPEGRSLRGVVLRCPVVHRGSPAIPGLLVYGLKAVSPVDLKARIFLFVTLFDHPPLERGRTGELGSVDQGASPIPTSSPTSPIQQYSQRKAQPETEVDVDSASEAAKTDIRSSRDRSVMGRGALLHNLPPPPLPHTRTQRKAKAANVNGKGRERDPCEGQAHSASTAAKRRRIEAEEEVGLGPQSAVVVEPGTRMVDFGIEQLNRNSLRVHTLLALTAVGLLPDHPEFGTLGAWITRGAAFALRDILRIRVLERIDIADAIAIHLHAYLPDEFKSIARPRITVLGCTTIMQEEDTQPTVISPNTVSPSLAKLLNTQTPIDSSASALGSGRFPREGITPARLDVRSLLNPS